MDPAIIGFIGFALLFVLIAFGVPIGFSFISVEFLGIVFLSGLNAAISALARIPSFHKGGSGWILDQNI